MEKLNRKDIVDAICEETNLSKKEARTAIDITFDMIEAAIVKGEEVNITNFGVFVPKTRQPRDGTHPKNHNRIKIEETKTVTFRVSKALKNKIN